MSISKKKKKPMAPYYLATFASHFHYFIQKELFTIQKELSDCPVDAIRLVVSFPYSYVEINLKILN
jgi:hypothetical protein